MLFINQKYVDSSRSFFIFILILGFVFIVGPEFIYFVINEYVHGRLVLSEALIAFLISCF
jgi:hypothetical protein